MACNSYARYPDDNSIVTNGNCPKWGVNGAGEGEIGKWGNYNYRSDRRTVSRVIIWKPAEYAFGFAGGLLWCDDKTSDNLRAGDYWMVYVR